MSKLEISLLNTVPKILIAISSPCGRGRGPGLLVEGSAVGGALKKKKKKGSPLVVRHMPPKYNACLSALEGLWKH
jgi:hypothetical protein